MIWKMNIRVPQTNFQVDFLHMKLFGFLYTIYVNIHIAIFIYTLSKNIITSLKLGYFEIWKIQYKLNIKTKITRENIFYIWYENVDTLQSD